MSTAIIYYSEHHGNTKKLLNAIKEADPAVELIDVTKEGKLVQVVTEQNTYPFDGVFILRASIAPDQLVPGIRTENGRVVVNRNMQTNLPGLFAAGDITGTPYQYMKAAGEGNVAAIRAAGYILEKKK